MITVLLIEDHLLIRQAMRLMLEEIQGVRIVGEAGTGEEGLKLRRDKEPDVIILDFQLPDTNGLELSRKLLRRDATIKILMVTGMEGDLLPMRLLEVGVRGFITKSSDTTELEQAIRAVYKGQRYISSAIANRLALSKTTTAATCPFKKLSDREMEVLLLLAKGKKAEAIAKQLHITGKTVNSHRYRIFEKLGVKNDVELIKLAVQYGLVEIDKT
ncbi:response regulator [Coxiella burnetii]|uniref:Response regulator n=1 Tax=Coxiella burnetii (strain RSA 493 / Nine Mile phase I) TaxID=227377 RepID=Q83CR4_COXBU|nr:response regulator [Coxiella burnetii]NP_820045.1 response regulator [Coxiella burnetii RSA 493]AAO90559.1 response regulator [Coxiella burnetii RSA 493]ABX78434.1 transcriptional regulator, LuxR family [Coxiella burnetii RSA 331]AML49323.1 two-component system response regulator [Coxiella burnetii]AML55254.1 two-component system response regulator [Coxiella burnetii]ATN69231.1 two-component system response regulator [Coxiella burnetii]